MVHQGERLPFGFEARDDLARVHARLENLQSNATLHWLLLVGAPYGAEATLPDALAQLEAVDDESRLFIARGHATFDGVV